MRARLLLEVAAALTQEFIQVVVYPCPRLKPVVVCVFFSQLMLLPCNLYFQFNHPCFVECNANWLFIVSLTNLDPLGFSLLLKTLEAVSAAVLS